MDQKTTWFPRKKSPKMDLLGSKHFKAFDKQVTNQGAPVFGYSEPVFRLYGRQDDIKDMDLTGINEADKAEIRATKRWAFIYQLIA